MRKIKLSHKNLMIIEASFIFCKRHNIDFDEFMRCDEIMTREYNLCETEEFENICKDLRCYRYFSSYELKELTEEEYELCIDEFGENK